MKRIAGFFGSLLSHTLFLLNVLGILWLLVCYLASVTSPLRVPYLALASLTTPFAILINIGFAIFWLFTSRKLRALPSFLVLILLYRLVFSVFGIHYIGKNDVAPGEGKLKVITWNVHGLGIYDRPVDKTVPRKILKLIREEDPDILCLQEFYTNWKDGMQPHSDYFLKEGGFREYRFSYDNSLGTKIYIGTALYSKYPLHNLKETQIAENVKMMQCDVELPGKQMLRTYFIHLQSFLLLDKDKKMIEEMKVRREMNLPMEASRIYARQFNTAYEKRAAQADLVAQIIQDSPHTVLVCGDMNDLPGSYTYTTIKGSLKDAFAEKGRGLGRTYNGISPTLRIDHMFYDPSLLRIVGFKSPRVTLSDHNPVIASFKLIKADRRATSTDADTTQHIDH